MKIKHVLIPSRHNKFHPHILRPIGLAVVLGILVLIPPAYNITSAQTFQVLGYATSVSIDGLNQNSNQQRINDGLKPLALNSKLNSAALAKAKDMMADNYWAHVAPDGTTPWYFITTAGYRYTTAGENLAKGFYASSSVVDAWMASPEHKANILNTSYEDVGYAILDGTLQGSDLTLVVAMYGEEYSEPEAKSSTGQSSTPTKTEPSSPTATTDNSSTKTSDNKASSSNKTSQDITQNSRQPGEVLGTAFLAPIKAYQTLNWGQKASILIICTIILLFILKHTLIWRQQRRGVKNVWLRSHPIGQASILIGVLIITLLSGVGAVL